MPDAVSESAIADRGAVGLSGSDLFQLFDALPSLVDWLALYFSLLAVTLLPAKLGVRDAVREIAIPVFLVLAYWDNAWLYLPVTMIAGYCLVRWVLLPTSLSAARPARVGGSAAINAALADWRSADFAGSQRDALGTSSTDALRDALLGGEWTSYTAKLAIVGRAQQDLGARQDEARAAALAAKRRAFSYYRTPLRPRAALAGALTGALIGMGPIAISLLTSAPPSDDGSYPVLNFLGTTAGTLLAWTGVGWFTGYLLPLIRGSNGVEKGLWLFLVWAVGPLLGALVWNDAGDWLSTLVADLQVLVVLVLVAVIVGDLRALREVGFGVQDWARVHNWRFVATWATALAAAIGTIAIAVATATITDISQEQFIHPPASSQSNSNSTPGH